MFCLHVILTALGVTQSALNVLGTEVNKKVRPGQNVTLQCDHAWAVGYNIYWFRNCSHYKQPPFIMSSEFMMKAVDRKIFRYAFQWNPLRSSNDLVIVNITESDLGLYYCSVSKTNVVDKGVIDAIQTHRFSNITYKLSFEDISPSPPSSCLPPAPDGVGQHWMLLVILCSLCALLSASISSTCVYCHCRKTVTVESVAYLKKRDTRKGEQDEDRDVCYVSLDVPTRANTAKMKKKRTQSSDYSTYSEVRTHH